MKSHQSPSQLQDNIIKMLVHHLQVKDNTVDPAKLPQERLLPARVIGSSAEELGPCGEKRKIAPTKATKHTRAKRTGLIIMQY